MGNLRKKKISALLTALIIFVSVVCVGIVFAPRLAGYKVFSIDQGSMTPTIPEGSLIYVKSYTEFESYSVGDIVTFSDMMHETYFTHRIVEIDTQARAFETKGDANKDVDPLPTEFVYAVGKVEFAIPYIGFLARLFRNKIVKIAVAAIYIAWVAIEIELIIAERKKRDE